MADPTQTKTPDPRHAKRVHRLANGDICVTLGDREHAMSPAEAMMLAALIEDVHSGEYSDVRSP